MFVVVVVIVLRLTHNTMQSVVAGQAPISVRNDKKKQCVCGLEIIRPFFVPVDIPHNQCGRADSSILETYLVHGNTYQVLSSTRTSSEVAELRHKDSNDMCTCVIFTSNRSFYPSTCSTTSVRADYSTLRVQRNKVLWPQKLRHSR